MAARTSLMDVLPVAFYAVQRAFVFGEHGMVERSIAGPRVKTP